MQEIFISYSSKDQQYADEIVAYLEQRGFSCFIAYRDIKAGESYDMRLIDAIEHAKIVVLVFSDNSDMSKHVKSEIAMAFDNETTIIPYKITGSKPTQLRYYLQTAHWLDATAPTTNHLQDLYNRISEIVEPSDNKQKAIMAVSKLFTERNFPCEIVEATDAPCYTRVTVQLTDTSIHPSMLQRNIMMLEREARYKIGSPTMIRFDGNTKLMLEITHDKSATFLIDEALEQLPQTMELPIVIGKDIDGQIVYKDLGKFTNVMVFGEDGSGKRNCIYCMLRSIMSLRTPQQVNFAIWGDKNYYQFLQGSPYLMRDVETYSQTFTNSIQTLAVERLKQMGDISVDEYNLTAKSKLAHIVVILDEMTSPIQLEALLQNYLTFRKAGIHLVASARNPLILRTTDNIDLAICHTLNDEDYFGRELGIDGATQLCFASGDVIVSDTQQKQRMRLLVPTVT